MTRKEFIKAIAKAAQKYAPQFGIKVVSPVIAQACLESAYGTSLKAKYHNYFGLKYRAGRCPSASGYFTDGSQEQNADGSYYAISDRWYKADTLDLGVKIYFEFINISNYSNLKGVTDPHRYLELIKLDGYATSLNYVESVYAVIQNWDLTQYDTISSSPQRDEINIIPNTGFLGYNVSTRQAPIAYICMHYVGAGGSAKNNVAYFNGGNRHASADYFVDQTDICAYNPDPLKYYCWSVGDGSNGTYGKICSNRNSISIEMCCYESPNGSDRWYFEDGTIKNAVKLVKYLMAKYNIPASHVIRHYDVSCKWCPGVTGWIPPLGESEWQAFKKQIGDSSITTESKQSSSNSTLPILKQGSTGGNVSDLQTKLNKLGYSLDVDGIFGPATYKAVISFQNQNNLDVDGIVGLNTWDVLNRLIAASRTVTQKTASRLYVGRVTASVLNVRSGPGTGYGKISEWPQLKRGNMIDIYKEQTNPSGEKWLYIRIAEKYFGYVSAQYIKKV